MHRLLQRFRTPLSLGMLFPHKWDGRQDVGQPAGLLENWISSVVLDSFAEVVADGWWSSCHENKVSRTQGEVGCLVQLLPYACSEQESKALFCGRVFFCPVGIEGWSVCLMSCIYFVLQWLFMFHRALKTWLKTSKRCHDIKKSGGQLFWNVFNANHLETAVIC